MALNQLQGLKAFVINHPPLIVFTGCVFLFGITTVSLAFIVERSDLPNPDITMDWNVFLSHLTQRSLCVHASNVLDHRRDNYNMKSKSVIQDTNSTTNSTPTVADSLIGVEQLSLSELLPDISSLKLGKEPKGPSVNVTKSMLVPLSFDSGLLHLPSAVTWLRGHVIGRHVGFSGKLSKEVIHVNMFLPSDLKERLKTFKYHCNSEADCKMNLDVCMVFFGPASVIPKTRQFRGCRHWMGDIRHAANTTLYLPEFVPMQCAGNIPLKVAYETNPSLTAMLSSMDKSIVTLHLMYTSYLIFFILITMLCYALVRSNFSNTKTWQQKSQSVNEKDKCLSLSKIPQDH